MGVLGLTSFLATAGEVKSIQDENRRSVSENGRPLTLAVDAASIMATLKEETCADLNRNITHVTDPQYEAINNPNNVLAAYRLDYSAFGRKMVEWTSQFVSAGVRLRFYFEFSGGASRGVLAKESTLDERCRSKVEKIMLLQHVLDGDVDVGSLREGQQDSIRFGSPSVDTSEALFLVGNLASSLPPGTIEIRRCIGEADFYLMHDAKVDPSVDGIISGDSDFFGVEGAYFIPLSSIRVQNSGDLVVKTFTREYAAKHLQLRDPAMFTMLSVLAGNDYTKPLTGPHATSSLDRQLGLEYRGSTSGDRLRAVVQYLNKNGALPRRVLDVAARNPAFAAALELSRADAGDVVAEEHSLVPEPVLAGLTAGKLDYGCLSEFVTGVSSAGVQTEALSDGPPVGVFSKWLRVSLLAVLGHTDRATIKYYRQGRMVVETVNPREVLSSEFFTLLAQRAHVPSFNNGVALIVAALEGLHPVIDFGHTGGASARSEVLIGGAQLGSTDLLLTLSLVYLLAASAKAGDPLTATEVAAFICHNAIMRHWHCSGGTLTLLPTVESVRPTMRFITLQTRMRNTNKLLRQLMSCTTTGIVLPVSSMLYNGNVLQCAMDVVAPLGLDEPGVNLLETLLNRDSLGFELGQRAFVPGLPVPLLDVAQQVHEVVGTVVPMFASGVLPDVRSWKEQARARADALGEVLEAEATVKWSTGEVLDDMLSDEDDEELTGGPTNAAGETAKVLPIAKHRAGILKAVKENPITVISAETGAGKSSQVPKYLLEQYRALCAENGKPPMLVVTQPRRIAAVTLAKRVAAELGEEVGYTSGYAIGQERMSDRGGKPTSILFVTAGWLLQKLLGSPAFYRQCTHLVLDEIHERSLDSDLLYLVVKQAVHDEYNERGYHADHTMEGTRLVLMSATFNSALFADYFAIGGAFPPPPQMEVGVKRFPVDIVYLDELSDHQVVAEFGGPAFSNSNMAPFSSRKLAQLCGNFSNLRRGPSSLSTENMESLYQLIVVLALALARKHSEAAEDPDEAKLANCVLVFLPGMPNIDEVYEVLMSALARSDVAELVEVVLLHSTIEFDEQLRAFEPIEDRKTRIVLSTNIAESSVTIPNVRYIIDLGMHKQMEHDEQYQRTALVQSWISKASANQRSGRAGRLCPGTCFRLYPRRFYDVAFQDYEVPEMLRLALTQTVLRLKVMAQAADADSPFSNVSAVLQSALQPPEESNVENAIGELLKTGALEGNSTEQHALLMRSAKQVSAQDGEDSEGDTYALGVLTEDELWNLVMNYGLDTDEDALSTLLDELDLKAEEEDAFLEELALLAEDAREQLSVFGSEGSFEVLDEVRFRLAEARSRVVEESRREMNDAIVTSRVTELGEFLSVVPLDMRYGKFIAMAARSGTYLPHAVVISVALSMPDLFVRPHPSMERTKYADLIVRTTLGRLIYDQGDLSEMFAAIRIYIDSVAVSQGLHRPAMIEYGLNVRRAKQLVRSVAEIASRLLTALPRHTQYLLPIARWRDVRSSTMTSLLTLATDADKNFLRLLIVATLGQQGHIMVGHGKLTGNAIHATLGKNKLPSAKQLEVHPGDAMLIATVPVALTEGNALREALGPLDQFIKTIHVSSKVVASNKAAKKKRQTETLGMMQPWEYKALQDSMKRGQALLEPEDTGRMYKRLGRPESETLAEARAARCSKGFDSVEVATIAEAAMSQMFRRPYTVPHPEHPEQTVSLEALTRMTGFSTWTYLDADVVAAPSANSIAAWLQLRELRGGRTVYAVAGEITFSGVQNTGRPPRAFMDRCTMMPDGSGFIALAALLCSTPIGAEESIRRKVQEEGNDVSLEEAIQQVRVRSVFRSTFLTRIPSADPFLCASVTGTLPLSPELDGGILASKDFLTFAGAMRQSLAGKINGAPDPNFSAYGFHQLMKQLRLRVDGRVIEAGSLELTGPDAPPKLLVTDEPVGLRQPRGRVVVTPAQRGRGRGPGGPYQPSGGGAYRGPGGGAGGSMHPRAQRYASQKPLERAARPMPISMQREVARTGKPVKLVQCKRGICRNMTCAGYHSETERARWQLQIDSMIKSTNEGKPNRFVKAVAVADRSSAGGPAAKGGKAKAAPAASAAAAAEKVPSSATNAPAAVSVKVSSDAGVDEKDAAAAAQEARAAKQRAAKAARRKKEKARKKERAAKAAKVAKAAKAAAANDVEGGHGQPAKQKDEQSSKKNVKAESKETERTKEGKATKQAKSKKDEQPVKAAVAKKEAKVEPAKE